MFYDYKGRLYRVDDIRAVDIKDIDRLEIRIQVGDSAMFYRKLEGMDTVNFIYRFYPHLLEGKRLKFIKHGWMIHNLIGHPLMQLLCFFKCYKLGMRIHDKTIPKPRGVRDE
jgi:hypothetical protein